MIYILAKLQEDYQIPYIPTKGCNPAKLLTHKNIYDEALFCASAGGNIQFIDYFLEKGAKDISTALINASRYSDLNTVKYLLTKVTKVNNDYLNYVIILEGASAGGKIETMKFALDVLNNLAALDSYGRGALAHAINNGQIEAINFLIENGITIRPINVEKAEFVRRYDIAEHLRKFL
jgi:ankyrin repeat protein